MKFIERKHTLSVQHGLIVTVTERFVTALVVGPQDYRHLIVRSHFVEHYIADTFST